MTPPLTFEERTRLGCYGTEVEELRAEIEQLKAALRQINNCAAKHKYDAMAMRDIARAALEGINVSGEEAARAAL